MAITVRANSSLYRFPDDTPQDVMKGAIDKHIASFQSLESESTLGGNKPAIAPFDPAYNKAMPYGEAITKVAKTIITDPFTDMARQSAEGYKAMEKEGLKSLVTPEGINRAGNIAMVAPQTGIVTPARTIAGKLETGAFSDIAESKALRGMGKEATPLKWISDEPIKWKGYITDKPQKLGDVFEHPELFERAPEAKNVIIRKGDVGEWGAWFDPAKNEIVMNPKYLVQGGKESTRTVLHEISHKLDDYFGMPTSEGSWTTKSYLNKTLADWQEYRYSLDVIKLIKQNPEILKQQESIKFRHPISGEWEDFKRVSPEGTKRIKEELEKTVEWSKEHYYEKLGEWNKYWKNWAEEKARRISNQYQNYTPEKIAENPYLGSDIPNAEDLIVRFGKGKQAVEALIEKPTKTDIMHLQADIQSLKTALLKAKTKKASKRINNAIKEREAELKGLQ